MTGPGARAALQVVRQTYDRNEDTFRTLFLIAPCAVLAVLIPQRRTTVEVGALQAPRPRPALWTGG